MRNEREIMENETATWKDGEKVEKREKRERREMKSNPSAQQKKR